MILSDIPHYRLIQQQLSQQTFESPAEVVSWLGAVQAQDYAGAKWALGQRVKDLTDAVIEQAFTDGVILRTHALRPTWHFVTPADIRWMLALTAPRINAMNTTWYRRLELDDALFARSNAAIASALQGGEQLTRTEIASVLRQAGIPPENLVRLGYIIHRAEIDAVVCSGGRRGRQYTYALLDERAPQARTLPRDEALAELTRRYFTSHGPATLKDFEWWSGLTASDAKAGIELVSTQLEHDDIGDQRYWFSASMSPVIAQTQKTYLLPNYDEYIVGYTDRSAIFDESHREKLDSRGNVLFNNTIVMDGQITGTWKRTFAKGAAIIERTLFTSPSATEENAFADAIRRYGAFLDMDVSIANVLD